MVTLFRPLSIAYCNALRINLSGYYTGTTFGFDRVFSVGNRVFAVEEYNGIKIFDCSPQDISERSELPVTSSLELIFVDGTPAIRLELPTLERAEVSVFDVSGRLVWKEDFHPERNPVVLELPTDLPSGIYMVEVRTPHLSTKSKFVIFR